MFRNIEAIEIEGGGTITFREDGTIEGATDVTQTKGTLKIKGEQGSTFISGGNMVISGGTSCNYFGNHGVASFIGSVGSDSYSYISNNGSSYSFNNGDNGRSGTAIINGVEVDLSRLEEISTKPKLPKLPKTSKVFSIDKATTKIKTIRLKGSATLLPIPDELLSDNIIVNVVGSGDILFGSNPLSNITINLKGSGNVTGKSTPVNNCMINLVGSGDINGFVATGGIVNLVGSGDIRIKSPNPSNISSSKVGTGSIKILNIYVK